MHKALLGLPSVNCTVISGTDLVMQGNWPASKVVLVMDMDHWLWRRPLMTRTTNMYWRVGTKPVNVGHQVCCVHKPVTHSTEVRSNTLSVVRNNTLSVVRNNTLSAVRNNTASKQMLLNNYLCYSDAKYRNIMLRLNVHVKFLFQVKAIQTHFYRLLFLAKMFWVHPCTYLISSLCNLHKIYSTFHYPVCSFVSCLCHSYETLNASVPHPQMPDVCIFVKWKTNPE